MFTALARAGFELAVGAPSPDPCRVFRAIHGIALADYDREPTEGTLVGVTPTRFIVAREETETGVVHVHFPQAGYVLKQKNHNNKES